MPKQNQITERLCNILSEVTDQRFPCFCGLNPLGGTSPATSKELKTLDKIEEILTLFKEEINEQEL